MTLLGRSWVALGPLLGRSGALRAEECACVRAFTLFLLYNAFRPLLSAKRAKKEPNISIKPASAVNGKRRLQTLLVIKNVLLCICSFYFLEIQMC